MYLVEKLISAKHLLLECVLVLRRGGCSLISQHLKLHTKSTFPANSLASCIRQLQGDPNGTLTGCLGQKVKTTGLVHTQQLFRGGFGLEPTHGDVGDHLPAEHPRRVRNKRLQRVVVSPSHPDLKGIQTKRLQMMDKYMNRKNSYGV